jgi:hypothetical protein
MVYGLSNGSRHRMIVGTVVLVHLKESLPLGDVWHWLYDAARDLNLNYFNGRAFQETAHREPSVGAN